MRNRIGASCLVVLALAVSVLADAECLFVANLKAGKPQTIVTYGTSLTAGAAWVGQLRDALNAQFPGLATVINSGESAMSSGWGVANLEPRVIAKKPDAVFIEFAINDAFLMYLTSVPAARSLLTNMIGRLQASQPQAEIILMTMNSPIGSGRIEYRPDIRAYYDVYRDVAKERKLLLIDHNANWEALLRKDTALFRKYVPDGIHPSPEACTNVISPAIFKALGLQVELPAGAQTPLAVPEIAAPKVVVIAAGPRKNVPPRAEGQTAAYTNSLGMKFVPVPGTRILMCIHETRNRDYAQYAAANPTVDMSWKEVKIDSGKDIWALGAPDDHPVVNVSWDDAKAFCAWLSGKEGKTCRLPSDLEWSYAVGIGDEENPKDIPHARSGKAKGYPWGPEWPPPHDNVGNFCDADAETASDGLLDAGNLSKYRDGFLLTAPVMSYPPNKLGLYDLGGNVWEWCQDVLSPQATWPVMRGGSWLNSIGWQLPSSWRHTHSTGFARTSLYGFRCVVEAGSSAP
jgi:formylglycine-generating enzyme required for sulfatase activity/lysophospholipase L1-like esterase